MRDRIRGLRDRLGRARDWLLAPWRSFVHWQSEIPDEGRVAIVGLGLAGIGFGLERPSAGLIVPGLLMAAAGLADRLPLRHPLVASVAIAAGAVVAITAIVVR